MASIQLKLFASLREAVGVEQQRMEITSDFSVAMLLEQLSKESDSFKEYVSDLPVLVAVNQAMVDMDFILQDSDEVALFPPVTGG